MSDEIHLEDPEFEPTDEQLIGLATRAFAHVRAQNAASLERVREEIAKLRAESLARWATQPGGTGTTK